MTTLTAEERGDLVEALLPEAAGLAVAVREEGQEQIASRLHGLGRHELEALAVVLAAMVDPDRRLKDALSWIDFDENGDPLEPMKHSNRTVRSLVRRGAVDRAKGVDMVAVERTLKGERFDLTSFERTAAIDLGLRWGMSYDDVAERLGMTKDAVKRSWERSKKSARENGRYVPLQPVGQIAA